MARLTAAQRRNLPDSAFALPKQRKYPLDTRARAANAKGRANQQETAGRLTSAQEATIDRKADKVLSHGRPEKKRACKGG